MIEISNVVSPSGEQWNAVIRGMRNPMNSWDKSDSEMTSIIWSPGIKLGESDHNLMMKLRNNGSPSHRKFMRMIPVYFDINAPLYWWSEYDTYKVGTVANSCSKMHKLLAKPFEMNDFSFDKLHGYRNEITQLVDTLNELRDAYFCSEDEDEKKNIWYVIIQLLPVSYNQLRTVFLNYEVLANIYHDRKDHKLDEWRKFCEWIKTLPYSELITGEAE